MYHIDRNTFKKFMILFCLICLFSFSSCSDTTTTTTTTPCPVCGGSGICPTCHGQCHFSLPGSPDGGLLDCPSCQGSGVCWKCGGTGFEAS